MRWDLPELGVGIVYFPDLEPLLAGGLDAVGLIEVEPATLWTFKPQAPEPYRATQEAFARLQELPQAKLVHGVGFPVGGSSPPDPRHLPPLVRAIEEIGAPWASEHLAFNRVGGLDGFNTGFLLPPLQAAAGARAAVETIASVASALPVPFLVETGVNYLQPRVGEMSDGQFTAAVVQAADCGILLDVHNLWANERNGRQSIEDFLAEIPLERVVEIHIAGGNELNGYWLDAHSGACPQPLAELTARILPRLPNARALVFEILPTYIPRLGIDGIRRQLDVLREMWEGRRVRESLPSPPSTRAIALPRENGAKTTAAEWEMALGSLVIDREPAGERASELAAELAGDPGTDVLQQLVWQFRAGAISDALELTCKLLLLHGGERFTRDIFTDFFHARPPELFGSAEGAAFAAYLDSRGIESLGVPFLAEVLAFEVATLQVLIDESSQIVSFSTDPLPLLESIASGVLPTQVQRGSYEVEVTPERAFSPGILLATT